MIPDSLFMIQKVCRILTLCSIVLMCIALGYVGYVNFRDWDSLAVEYQFKDDARIFGLYPPDRVSKFYPLPVTRYPLPGFQELAASPAYLDVRYWQNFKKARVEIEYSKDPEVDFQIGYKVGKDFQWELIDVEKIQDRHFDQSEPGERSGEIPALPDASRGRSRNEERVNDEISRLRYVSLEMTLDGEYVERNNVHRWIFSSTNVQDLGKAIRIYGIKFEFTR